MALYEYLCPACGKAFELMRPMSDAHQSAVCPGCGSEAQRVISRGSSDKGPTQPASGPSRNDSEIGTPAGEAMVANQRIAMIPAYDVERSPGHHDGPSGGGLRGDMDVRRSSGSTSVSAPAAVREGAAARVEVDLQEDTVPLEMPWLTESQPGGGNLWYIRDWGIASMFGYLREKRAPDPVGETSFLAVAADASLVEPDEYSRIPGRRGAAQVEPDTAAGPADAVGGHPTFSEWRTAISIMPWLQETGVDSPEAVKEIPDIVIEETDMPGLRPRRDRATIHLAWAGWLNSRPAGEQAADTAKPRSRPAKEGPGADFPKQVIEAAWRRQGGRCAGCGRWLIYPHRDRDSGTGAWESHHRIPVDQGGSSLLANCVLFCSSLADCHFNMGHGGIGWAHYAPLDESGLLFLFAGSTAATDPTAPVRPKRSLLKDVLGIPQVGRDRGKPSDGSGKRDSTG